MLAHSSAALSLGHRPPANAEIEGLFATVINPVSLQPQRVQILCTYTAFGNFSEPPFRVALVRGLHPQASSYTIALSALRRIVVHYAVEM